jgi:hypothetical protein
MAMIQRITAAATVVLSSITKAGHEGTMKEARDHQPRGPLRQQNW